jgi:hypothetical protein
MVHGMKCCLLAGCCFLTLSLQAVSLKSFFFNMPDDVLPTLSQSARKDLVDYFENKQTAAVPSLFNSSIILSAFSDDYLRLETSSVSSIQIKKLPLEDGAVFLLINTALGPLPDSRLRLYTENWKPIPGFSLPELKPRLFLDSARLSAEQMIRFDGICRLFVRMDADPSAPVIHLKAFITDDVPEELLAPFKDLFTDSLTLTWNGRGFQF